jgi:arylsulfatase A-like enzyme
VAPTIADVFGVLGKGGSDREFQGRSLLPLLAGERGGKPALLSRTVWDRPRYALRHGRFKLIYDSRTGEAALYDLVADPEEKHDVAGANRLRTQWLLQELQHWISTAGNREATGPAAKPTPEECERLRALGYVAEGC